MKQLTLNLLLPDDANWENFYAGPNKKSIQYLQNLDHNTIGQFTYFWGVTGAGRSHILMAACRQAGKLNLPAAYLPLRDQKNLSPKIFENLEHIFLLCLDDLDAIAGKPLWEEALFHCFNRLAATGGNLMVTANAAPRALNFKLPDLKSRFSSCLVFQLKSLTHEQKIKALHLRAKQCGLLLPAKTSQFLLNHYQRDLRILFGLLEKLSKATLETKHALTIPFVKKVLDE